MKSLTTLLAILLSGCATCAGGASGVERRDDHGNGFCEATLAVSGDFGFESVGHFNHCFYKSRDFGGCYGMSVAPSASIALWQESSSGSIVAYRPSWAKPIVLLKSFPAPSSLESTVWDEGSGSVTVKAWQQPERHKLAIPGGG
jgi:hypothetical protein